MFRFSTDWLVHSSSVFDQFVIGSQLHRLDLPPLRLSLKPSQLPQKSMVALTQVVLNTAVALLLAAVVLLCDWAPIALFSLFRNAVYLVTLLHSDTPDNSCTFLFILLTCPQTCILFSAECKTITCLSHVRLNNHIAQINLLPIFWCPDNYLTELISLSARLCWH